MSLVLRRWMTPPEAALICEEDPQPEADSFELTGFTLADRIKDSSNPCQIILIISA